MVDDVMKSKHSWLECNVPDDGHDALGVDGAQGQVHEVHAKDIPGMAKRTFKWMIFIL